MPGTCLPIPAHFRRECNPGYALHSRIPTPKKQVWRGFTMSLLERLTDVPLTHRTSEAWRAAANLQVKGACSGFLFFEHQQDARTRIPTVESSAAALRPGTPIFATLLLVFFSAIGVNLSSAATPDIRLLPLILPGSEVVAGIRAPLVDGQPSNYLFITKDDRVDLGGTSAPLQGAGFYSIEGTTSSPEDESEQ